MLPAYLNYIAAIIIILGDSSYLIDTAKGNTQPNKVSWFFGE